MFSTPSIWVNLTSWQVFVFNYWQNKSGVIISTSPLFRYDVQNDDAFKVVYKPFVLGTIVLLQEEKSKLYLHVYDHIGRHVGFGYEKNQTEVQIPGAYYYDSQNGTIIILLPLDITEFRILVDGRYAEKPIENYTLMVGSISESNLLHHDTLTSYVKRGVINEYTAKISLDKKVSVVAKSEGLAIYWYLSIIVFLVIGICGIVFYLRKRKLRGNTTLL